jgi:hypothetical protein
MENKGHLLVRALNEALQAHRFHRTKRTWHLACEETVLAIDLQKSNWGTEFFINLGILIRVLSGNPKPRTNECHVVERLDRLVARRDQNDDKSSPRSGHEMPAFGEVPDKPQMSIDMSSLEPKDLDSILRNRPLLVRALDLDDLAVDDHERVRIIQREILAVGLPFLRSCDSISKVCNRLSNGLLTGAAVWRTVYEVCHLECPE